MTFCSTPIRTVKVVGNFGDTVINNALTFDGTSLQFGGPLVHDTKVTGNFALSFGETANKIRQFGVVANNQVNIVYDSGIYSTSFLLNSSGILLRNTLPNAKGLHSDIDFSNNYDSLTYVQKIYTDKTILGKSVSSTLLNPGAGQTGYTLVWNNTNGQFDLTPPSSISPGLDKQVIFNSLGVLTGNSKFLYDFNSFTFSTPYINLGTTEIIGGNTRIIQVISNGTDTNLAIRTKGAGTLELGINTGGSILLGTSQNNDTLYKLTATGLQTQIDLAIEPKGTDGKVFIGNQLESGGYRYLTARGSVTDINFYIQSKGNGSIILSSSTSNPTLLGAINEAITYRILKAGTSSTSDIAIAGTGLSSIVYLGDNIELASNRYLRPGSGSSNTNLLINAKGTGYVAVNNIVTSKKIAIGDWNMDTDALKLVTHGIADYTKIIRVDAVIFNDALGTYKPLASNASTGGTNGGQGGWGVSDVILYRETGKDFDSVNYDATGFNRGYIYITYEI